MPTILGKYINLARSAERRKIMELHLDDLGLTEIYQRFEAETGDPKEAEQKNLSKGELGLWRSWLKLLKQETENSQSYDYLHIIEDDAILSQQLKTLINNIERWQNKFDILVTDMYVNPSIYNNFESTYRPMIHENKIAILQKNYTGCTSSCIIPREKVKKVKDMLEKYFNENKEVIPIDNYLRRINADGALKICCTAPFVTSVRLDSHEESTIQKIKNHNECIKRSQRICLLLRRELSTVGSPIDVCERLIKELSYLIENNTMKRSLKSDILVKELTRYAYKNGLLAYALEPRLANEPDNNQRIE